MKDYANHYDHDTTLNDYTNHSESIPTIDRLLITTIDRQLKDYTSMKEQLNDYTKGYEHEPILNDYIYYYIHLPTIERLHLSGSCTNNLKILSTNTKMKQLIDYAEDYEHANTARLHLPLQSYTNNWTVTFIRILNRQLKDYTNQMKLETTLNDYTKYYKHVNIEWLHLSQSYTNNWKITTTN